MSELLNKQAPDFNVKAYFAEEDETRYIKMSDYRGKYVVLFFYPFDYTFVCPTEIMNFSEISPYFKEINCEVIGCSVDSAFVHSNWC